MARKSFKVRKGIETEPLVWGLSTPYWGLVTMAGATIIITGVIMTFSSLRTGGENWYYGLLILIFGLLALLVVKSFLQQLSKPKKHNFPKKEIYLNQNDLLENL